MQAEPVRSVQVGPLQITLATGERGELLHLVAAPPEVRMRLKGVTALRVGTSEVSMRGIRQAVLEPVRGRVLAALAGDLGEEEVCAAIRAAASALFALAAEGARLPIGSVDLTTLVRSEEGRWQFDLVGSALHLDGGQERVPVEPGAHLSPLVRSLRLRPHLARAPRLRRLAELLVERPEAGQALVEATLDGKQRRVTSPLTWQLAAGAAALFLGVTLVTGSLGGRVFSRYHGGVEGDLAAPESTVQAVPNDPGTLLYRRGEAAERAPATPIPVAPVQAQAAQIGAEPGSAQTVRTRPAQPASAPPAPAQATPSPGPVTAPSQPGPAPVAPPAQPARPVGTVDLVIRHADGLTVLHGWAGEGTTWVLLDDLVGFLGARLDLLPAGDHLLTWQFGSIGIAARTGLEITDAVGLRYVRLTTALQGSMRLHEAGWDAGNLFFERERPV